jgi:hypothetical protein
MTTSAAVLVPELTEFLVTAARDGIEATLTEALSRVGLGGTPQLLAIQMLETHLERFKIITDPPLTVGDFNTARHFTTMAWRPPRVEPCDEIVALGESQYQEFKSTLYVDVKRHLHTAESPADCVNSAMTHGVMKTVTAFLNSERGGNLFIGVEDRRKPFGLALDSDAIGCAPDDYDTFEQRVRSEIESWIYDGRSVNSYVAVDFPPP